MNGTCPDGLAAPDIQAVRHKVAELIHDNMGIAAAEVLKDVPFTDLHEHFDSLAFLEMQLLLEKAYGFEFQIDLRAKLPMNATELAQELLNQQIQHSTKLAIKTNRTAAKPLPSNA